MRKRKSLGEGRILGWCNLDCGRYTTGDGEMRMEKNKIYCGDSLQILKTLPDESIDCCVTSPPYWGLRSYLPDKVQLKKDLSEQELSELRKELTLLGLNDTIRI